MANLLGQNIGTNYKGILNLGSTINTPVSGTLQAITDGDGLASALNVSTTSVAVSGTLGVTAGANLAIASGNVGVGTNAPDAKLVVMNGVGQAETAIFSGTEQSRGLSISILNIGGIAQTGVDFNAQHTTSSIISFSTNSVERARITENGVTFNGDTAAANALDDYEEGTWTLGVSFDNAAAGVTYSLNSGTYTKIGRKVTVNGIVILTSKGSSTGAARVTGLPFAIATGDAFTSAVTLHQENISFANQLQGYGLVSTTTIDLRETTEAGVNTAITNAEFADNSRIIISFTYFV
jgi:hypothetical protein